MNVTPGSGRPDPDDFDLERRLAAALRDAYPVEPVTDDDLAVLRRTLASPAGVQPPGVGTVSATGVRVDPARLATADRRPGPAWRTGLLAAAAVVLIALIGVAASRWTTAGTAPTPADTPAVPSTGTTPDGTVPLTSIPLPTAPAPETPVGTPDATPTTDVAPSTTDDPPSVPDTSITMVPPDRPTPSTTLTSPTAPGDATPVAADPQSFRVDDTRYEVPGMIEFRSPSGNIYCVMADRGVPGADCQVFTAGFTTTICPDPADLGAVLSVAGAGQTSDGSTTVADTVGRYSEACGYGLVATAGAPPASAQVLGYGRSLTYGGFTCVSAETGVTCRSEVNGAGFRVSRAAYQVF